MIYKCMGRLALPLALVVLGCGSPPAATSPSEPSAAAAAPPAEPSPTPTSAADEKPAKEQEKEAKKDAGPTDAAASPAPGAAAVDQKPLGGALTQNEIKSIVEQHGEYFNDCYTLGAGKSQQFVAKVTLKVTLGPTGNVNQALVTNSTAKNAKVDQCVVEGFKKIKFPAPKSGATSVFTFPMQFNGAVETTK